MNTITTLEKPSMAYKVLAYGWTPVYEAYRIKDYKLRRIDTISTSSLRLLERLVDRSQMSLSDCGGYWFKVVHYLDKPTPRNVQLMVRHGV